MLLKPLTCTCLQNWTTSTVAMDLWITEVFFKSYAQPY